jgi:hypothetical protein
MPPGAVDGLTAPGPASEDAGERDWARELREVRSEAKRHRLERNAAVAERDTLRARVDAADRREVERLAGERLQNAGDIWLTTDVQSLRDEDGELDKDLIAERVEHVLGERPHWRKTGPADFSSGVRRPLKPAASLGEAFKNAIHSR